MTPVEIYAMLPHSAQAACGKVASAIFSKAVGFAGGKITDKNAIAVIYRRWQDSFQSPESNEQELNAVFEEFFCRKRVIDELAKLGRDQYADVNFDVLVDELRESFEFARCPLPDTDLHREIDGWVRELRTRLEENGQYRRGWNCSK